MGFEEMIVSIINHIIRVFFYFKVNQTQYPLLETNLKPFFWIFYFCVSNQHDFRCYSI